MSYAIVTFGCRVNQADSIAIEEALRAGGAGPAPLAEADLVVVNTCSVTASADQGARQTIRRVARANPHARIVVTGCYATRRPEELRALPGVTSVVANDDKLHRIQLVGAGGLNRAGAQDEAPTMAHRFGEGDGPCGSPASRAASGSVT